VEGDTEIKRSERGSGRKRTFRPMREKKRITLKEKKRTSISEASKKDGWGNNPEGRKGGRKGSVREGATKGGRRIKTQTGGGKIVNRQKKSDIQEPEKDVNERKQENYSWRGKRN